MPRRACSGAARPPAPVQHGSGGLIWPVNGPITSPFCESRAWESCHPGIDIGVPAGTPIRAAASGRVVLMQSEAASGGYGNFTCIQHSGVALHVLRAPVALRDLDGRERQPGPGHRLRRLHRAAASATHLHFEIRINGSVVNPMNYL